MGGAGVRRGRDAGGDRAFRAGGRARLAWAAPAVGAADRGYQRHLGRVCGGGAEDGDCGGGGGEGVFPPGGQAGSGCGVRRVRAVRGRARAGGCENRDRAVQSGDPAVEVPDDSVFVRAAEAALRDEYGRAPVRIGCGGSIPVVEAMHRILGLDSLLMGFGLEDDQVHSPNEKFEIRCLDHGTRAHARLLGRLAGA